MTDRITHLLPAWRRFAAGQRGRALLAVLAVVVFGWQLALQGHVLGHDLDAIDGPCAYALQVHQATPLAPSTPALPVDTARYASPESTLVIFDATRAPLIERARGPPSNFV